ncbi:MAG: MaoC family dehydratase [Myxococcaceae bacterium]
MPARKLYFEAIRVGDELPALAKSPIDRVQLARYAGASGDFNPIHVDETYAKSIGMPSVYAPGMLVVGFLGQLVSDWARGAQLRRYGVRFIKMVWPGDTVVCKGRVTDKWGEGGRYFSELDLWAENQKGELVLKGQSLIQVFYSLEDENRQRAGQAPIVVNVPRQSLAAQVAAPPAEPAAPSNQPDKSAVAKKPSTGAKKAPSRERSKSAMKAAAKRPAPKGAKGAKKKK